MLDEKTFLKNYDSSKYEKPSVTADIVFFNRINGENKLLLIKRGNHPFKDCWALPGGFLNIGESIEDCAKRELLEETNLNITSLELLGVFSQPNRDPRRWVISCAYLAFADETNTNLKSGDDAAEAEYFDTDCVLLESETCEEKGVSFIKEKLEITIKNSTHAFKYITAHKRYNTETVNACDIEIISGEGLAFDHAKMISAALVR